MSIRQRIAMIVTVVLGVTWRSAFGGPCVTGTPIWQNNGIGPYTGFLVVTWRATPSQSDMDGLIGLSMGAGGAFADYACLVRFNENGRIDVRNGNTYEADAQVSYFSGIAYDFRAEIDIVASTYSVWVRTGSSETQIATNYAFRTEQQGVGTLDNWGVWAGIGSLTVCDFSVVCGNLPPPPPGTIFVDASNPACPGAGTAGDPLCSIQDAICVASDGHQIVVAPGTYNETIDLQGKMITLRSSGGSEVTTIDGSGLGGSVITCANGETVNTLIEGFTITGGTGTPIFDREYGGGLLVSDGGEPSAATIRSCALVANSAVFGGGLALQGLGNEVIVETCVFEANHALFSGGGMYAGIDTVAKISDSDFVSNESDGWAWPQLGGFEYDGGAIALEGVVELDGCTFESNKGNETIFGEYAQLEATGSTWRHNEGRAIQLFCSQLGVDQCVFEGNGGGIDMGAVDLGPCGKLRATRSRFLGNAFAIGLGSVNCAITNCEFSGNGQALSIAQFGFPPFESGVTNSTFFGNGVSGGNTIYTAGQAPAPILENCILWGNGPEPIGSREGDPPVGLEQCIAQFADGATVISDQPPRLVDPLGPDGLAGTPDDDLRIFGTSPAVDAGDNGRVGSDENDIDGDGDTTEPVPFDLASNPRFQDDPSVVDTGVGTPPVVDMGAYEWIPGVGIPSGPRWWITEAGGQWSAGGNWFGGLPGAADDAVFDLPGAYTTIVASPTQTRRLRVHDGDVLLDLNGGALDLLASTDFASVVGPTSVLQTPNLTVTNGTLSAASLLVGDRTARLRVLADAVLDVAAAETRGDGELAGTGLIVGAVTNLGRIDPGGDTIGSLAIAGDYTDVGVLPDGTSAAGVMEVTIIMTAHDALVVTGDATLGGALAIEFVDPPLETPITVLTANQLDGTFGAAITGTALPGRTVETPVYVNGRVEIVVREINLEATWDDGGDYSIGTAVVPSDAVLADFDNDTLPDIALALPEDLDQVYVFFNNGMGADPSDIFNDSPGQFCVVPVGDDPVALDAADLNGDGWNDLAVVNQGGSLQILINDQAGCFTPPGSAETTSVARPTDVITLSADADGSPDLAVSSLGTLQVPDQSVIVYRNSGDGLNYDEQSLEVSGTPVALAAASISDPRGLVDDLAAVLNTSNQVQFLPNDGAGTFVNTTGPITVGTEPCYIEPEDIDRDGLTDLVIVNFGSGTLAVLVSKDGGGFVNSPALDIGQDPTSLTITDGGARLAVIRTDEMGERVVDVYRNDSVPDFVFLQFEEKRFAGENPVIVRAADVDQDGEDDLIAITDPSSSGFAGAGGGGGRGDGRGVGLGPTPFTGFAAELQDPPCRADTDGSGSVGFADLTGLLNNWGQSDLLYDFDGNGTIGFADLTFLLNAWGPCS